MHQPPAIAGFGGGPGPFVSPVTRVELNVSAIKLRDEDIIGVSDPMCILYIKEKDVNSYSEFGRTEQIKNSLNPQWIKKFELDYYFEEKQTLKLHVFDWDTKTSDPKEQDSLGEVECTLGEIMGCQGGQFKKSLSSSGGTLVISGEEVSDSKEILTLNMCAKGLDKKDFMGKSDPFLVFYRSLPNSTFTAVHKTEVIKNNLNPVWNPIVIPVKSLCGGDEQRTIKIECYDADGDGSHDLIGECQTKLSSIKEGPGSQNSYILVNLKKQKKSRYKGSGTLILTSVNVHIEPTFIDYIKGGLQLHFTVAVDFTASNGDPQTPHSLHYRQPGIDNQYSLAIRSIGEIIQDYDTDKLFPALGFGARIPPEWHTSHEFFLNGKTDSPYCQGVQGILEAYYYSLQTVKLYGPTNFSPVIRHVSNFARNHGDGNYFVLLIITDGIISDLDMTKHSLVVASKLPMSVIIVGVGNVDFSTMELLDGDDKRLCHDGMYAARDIVQFVEMRNFVSSSEGHSRSALASAVLKEVPNQVVSYMKTKSASTGP